MATTATLSARSVPSSRVQPGQPTTACAYSPVETADDLLEHSADLFRTATTHPFLAGVRDGTLPPAAFDTWLVQDALFTADLLRFQAQLLARAPRPDQGVLAGGLVALAAELDWFDGHAARRGLDLTAERLAPTRAYAALLTSLQEAPYAVAVTALWVLERVYLDAWSFAAPGAEPYRELVEHWTSPDFAGYVAALARLVDVPADAPVVAEVLRQETAFWNLAQ